MGTWGSSSSSDDEKICVTLFSCSIFQPLNKAVASDPVSRDSANKNQNTIDNAEESVKEALDDDVVEDIRARRRRVKTRQSILVNF